MKKREKFKTIDIVYIGLFAAVTAICAWLSIPLSVPITLQTLAVCLVAGLLGAKRGTMSVIIYILLGAVGVPVFTGFKGGAGVLLGSTGGYIIGFIFTALIIGIVSDKTKCSFLQLAAAMAAGVIVCYFFGTVWFAVVYTRQGTPESIGTILGWCVIPFIIPDIIKIIIAAFLTCKLKKYIK